MPGSGARRPLDLRRHDHMDVGDQADWDWFDWWSRRHRRRSLQRLLRCAGNNRADLTRARAPLARPHAGARERAHGIRIDRARQDVGLHLRERDVLTPTDDRLGGGPFVDPRTYCVREPERTTELL